MNVELFFLMHRKGQFVTEGPFVHGESAQKARDAHRFTAHKYDIVVVELPCTIWEFNDN